jgi:hypothetical protein
MSVSLNLDYEQLKTLVDQLSRGEKEQLAEYLDEQTLYQRFRKVRDSLRDIPVTIEEITEEVEAVREGMHRASGRLIPTSG